MNLDPDVPDSAAFVAVIVVVVGYSVIEPDGHVLAVIHGVIVVF